MIRFGRKIIAPLLLIALLAVSLAGCTPIKPSIGGVGSTLFDVEPSQLGLLVGSFGPLKSERRFSSYALMIRHLPSKQGAAFQFASGLLGGDVPDFVNPASHGTIFTMKLPAGRYEIHNVGLYQSGGFGGHYRMYEDFSVPFTIEGGKATYIGEYILRRGPGGNVVPDGFGVSTGVFFEFDDKQARDMAFARQKWREFEAAPVVVAVPDFNAPNRLVVRPGDPPPPYLAPPK